METETKEKNEIGGDKKCYSIKIIFVGESGVGKTNLIYRLINHQFINDLGNTIGVDFFIYL